MPKIILCRGIQGSGKTTWSKQWVLEDPKNRVRFNNDDIRNMLGKYWVPSREQLIFILKEQFIEISMRMGYDIVIDNMNLNAKEIKFYKTYVETHNQTVEELRKETKFNYPDDLKYKLEFKDFFIPLQECIERDSKRPNPIGEEVIRKTYEKYKDIIEAHSESNNK